MIVENKNIFYHALRNLIISIIRDELSEMNNFRKKNGGKGITCIFYYYYYSNRITNPDIRVISNYSNEILTRRQLF